MTTYTKEKAYRDISDMVATYFAGVTKTQAELRDFIGGLIETMPAPYKLSKADAEQIACENEMRQGVKMF